MKLSVGLVVAISVGLSSCGSALSTGASSDTVPDTADAYNKAPTRNTALNNDSGEVAATASEPTALLPPDFSNYETKVWQTCDGCSEMTVDEAAKLLGSTVSLPEVLGAPDQVLGFPVSGFGVTVRWAKTPYGAVAISYTPPPPFSNGSVEDLAVQVKNQQQAIDVGGIVSAVAHLEHASDRDVFVAISIDKSGYVARTRGGDVVLVALASAAPTEDLRASFTELVASVARTYGDQPLR